jgi:hypothetical protein
MTGADLIEVSAKASSFDLVLLLHPGKEEKKRKID